MSELKAAVEVENEEQWNAVNKYGVDHGLEDNNGASCYGGIAIRISGKYPTHNRKPLSQDSAYSYREYGFTIIPYADEHRWQTIIREGKDPGESKPEKPKWRKSIVWQVKDAYLQKVDTDIEACRSSMQIESDLLDKSREHVKKANEQYRHYKAKLAALEQIRDAIAKGGKK